MDSSLIVFFILSILVIAGAVFMFTLDRLPYRVCALGLSILSTAGIFFWQGAMILALLQIIIHAGLLILFLPTLQSTQEQEKHHWAITPFVLVGLFLALLIGLIYQVPSLTDQGIAFTLTTLIQSINGMYLVPLLLVIVLQLIGLFILLSNIRKEAG